MYIVPKPPPKPMPRDYWPRERHGTGVLINAWAFIYAMCFVYGKAIFNAFDWFGKKLVHLIDHSDFFAGVVWTYAVMTAWELLTRG